MLIRHRLLSLLTSVLGAFLFFAVVTQAKPVLDRNSSMTNAESHLPPADVVLRVLKSEAPYADETQKQACGDLVDELTEEEQEMAARTSYAYWVATTSGLLTQDEALDVRRTMAMREARRHYKGQDEKYERALEQLREAIQDRKERQVDVFRTCFRHDVDYGTEEELETAKRYRDYIQDDMQKQQMVVRGKDRKSQAIVLKFPRLYGNTEVESYIAAQIYIAERGIATTEILTEGKLEKVMAIFDFGQYSSKNSPPLSAMQSVAQVLQRNYPERLSHLLVLNAPLWIRMLFKVLTPFLSKATRDKIQVASENQMEEVLSPLVEDDVGGSLTAPFDVDVFFRQPFHELYAYDPALEDPSLLAHQSEEL